MPGHIEQRGLTGVRQELKYLLLPATGARLKEALSQRIPPKVVNGADHSWRISVYLDHPDYRMTRRGLENGSQTTKIRVKRYYLLQQGQPVFDDTCWLEVKTRAGAMVEKSRFQVPSKHVLEILKNGPKSIGRPEDEIAMRNFEDVRQQEPLLALFVAHYRRHTFQDKSSRVRITIDDQVSFHVPPEELFTEAVPICSRAYLPPPLKMESRWIMEVKSLGPAPSWIETLLDGTPHCEYSKFVTGINAIVERGLLTVEKTGLDKCL